jgi:hypothetical protein
VTSASSTRRLAHKSLFLPLATSILLKRLLELINGLRSTHTVQRNTAVGADANVGMVQQSTIYIPFIHGMFEATQRQRHVRHHVLGVSNPYT